MTEADRLRTGKVTIMKQADILRCPHCILMPEHYRADGTCLCDDPNATVMVEWGYRWNGTQWGGAEDGDE